MFSILRCRFCCLVVLMFGLSTCVGAAQVTQLPSFSFDELKVLSAKADPGKPLAAKLDRLLHSVEVGSFAGGSSGKLSRPVESGTPVLRAAMWNIERGQEFEPITTALKDPEAFYKLCAKRPLKPARLSLIQEEAELLSQSDLLILNEVDSGMKRSEYHAVARELAAALHMNYAYAIEFVEVDPVHAWH